MGILSPETEALLAAQASLRGETPDALVRRLLGAARPAPKPIDLAALEAIQQRIAAHPLLDDRPPAVIRNELYQD